MPDRELAKEMLAKEILDLITERITVFSSGSAIQGPLTINPEKLAKFLASVLTLPPTT